MSDWMMRTEIERPAWFRSVRRVLILAAGNYLVWNFILYPALPDAVPDAIPIAVYIATRAALMVWAGYAAFHVGRTGLSGAASAGVAVIFVDHVVLKGGYFMVLQVIVYMQNARFDGYPDDFFYQAALGVLVSFVMFSPLAGILGVFGGRLARRRRLPA